MFLKSASSSRIALSTITRLLKAIENLKQRSIQALFLLLWWGRLLGWDRSTAWELNSFLNSTIYTSTTISALYHNSIECSHDPIVCDPMVVCRCIWRLVQPCILLEIRFIFKRNYSMFLCCHKGSTLKQICNLTVSRIIAINHFWSLLSVYTLLLLHFALFCPIRYCTLLNI